MEIKSLLYIVILVVIELLSVTSLKHWSNKKNKAFLFIGLFGYFIVGAFFAYILCTHSEITIVNSLWQVLNVILISSVGLLIFKEHITNKQMIGVCLAIVATILLAID